MKTDQEFIKQSIKRLNEYTPRIFACLDMLTEAEIWKKPNKNSNSIANLILHLCGNITQYILSALGDSKDLRERDLEFQTESGYTKLELLQKLHHVVSAAIKIIENTNEKKLLKIHAVQGFKLSGIGIILHVVEHYSYHTGQIVFYTKLVKDKDLEFYANYDLNAKNKE